jgi:hypothetical protein
MISTVVLGWQNSAYSWIFVMGALFAVTYFFLRLPQFVALKSRAGFGGISKVSGMVLVMQTILSCILFFIGMGFSKMFSLF